MPPDIHEKPSNQPPIAQSGEGAGWLWLPALLGVLATCLVQGWGPEWPPARQFLVQLGINLCVLLLYLREFVRHGPSFMELSGLLLVTVCLLFLAYKAVVLALVVILFLSFLWLLLAWLAYDWPARRGLVTLALFLTLLQGLLSLWNGLRPSDHGALGGLAVSIVFQAVLTLGLLALSRPPKIALSVHCAFYERLWADVLVLVLFVQALVGLALRDGATDFWRNFHLFLGSLATLLALFVGWRGRTWLLGLPYRRWLVPALLMMPLNQLALGLYARLGGEAAWLGPLHTTNGLFIFAAACLMSGTLWFSHTQDS